MMDKLKKEKWMNELKIKFINEMSKIDFKKTSKREIFELLLTKGFKPEPLKKFLQLEAYRLSKTEIENTLKKIVDLTKEYEWYKSITPLKLYRLDLKDLKKSIRRMK
jgi:hypothetical protein